jgi:type II restriction enzyme
MTVTASSLVSFITRLPKHQQYSYISPKNKGLILLDSISQPEGPIYFRRFNPEKGQGPQTNDSESISTEMLWRVANAIRENVPFNVDRIVGASYNTRSVLETLLAHTPQFYYCYPGRIERIADSESIQRGHKHLLWCPQTPHVNGVLQKRDIDLVISEIPSREVIYDAVSVVEGDNPITDINVQRRHAQIQIALFLIGVQLGYRTWIAQNDKGILYRNKKICEYPGIICDLRDEQLLRAYSEAAKAALLIDCIWFKNGRLMPAVMEVEQSTGVRSGLTRMKNFMDRFPPFPTRWVIVAPDEDRNLVMKECESPQFAPLKPKYFPYSAVEELYSLCSRRKVHGITEEFLDCFMENTIPA